KALNVAHGINPGRNGLRSGLARFAKARCSDGEDVPLGGSLIHQSLESGGLVNGEVRQNLTVDVDAGLQQPADKSAVGDAMLAARRIDPLDPKSAKIPLLQLATN